MKKGNRLLIAFILAINITSITQAQWTSTNYASGNINVVFANGNDILAGTNGGSSISISVDNGINWGSANTGILQYADVRAFASDQNYVFAGATDGVYRAINDGSYNWSKVLDNVSCFSLLIKGTDVFAGTLGGGIYYSNNNGTTWIQSNSGMNSYPYVYALATNGTYLFAGKYGGGSPADGVYRSSDNGATWTQVINGLTNTNVFSLAVKGNFLFAGTNGGIFRSSNDGNNWINVAGGVVHTLNVICNNDLYAGLLSSGGVSKSTDDGTTWSSYSTGLPNTGGYTVMSLTANNSFLFAGTLGGGIARGEYECSQSNEQNEACITWNLLSSTSVTSTFGNIYGQAENIQGLLIFPPYINEGQRLWYGTNGWAVSAGENPSNYIEFNASPTSGNNFTVTNVSFNYGDNPLQTNFNIIKSQVYYSTDNWANRTLLNSTPLDYLNTSMQSFSASGLSVTVSNGHSFSLRIYPYAPNGGIAMTPSFAIHNNVTICGITAVDSSGGCVEPPNCMVGWWPLDETVGSTVVKDIIGSNNGSPQPGPIGVMGSATDGPIPGSILSFLNPKYKVDGSLYFYPGVTTKYVKVPDNPSLNFGTGDFTIDAWVYPVIGSNYVQPIVDKSQTTVAGCIGYRLFILSGQLHFVVMDGNNIIITTAPITYSKWQHIAAVRKGGTPNSIEIYINGNLIITATGQVNNISNTSDFLIGGITSPNGGTLCGLPAIFNYGEIAIDELELFNRALASNEIYSIWYADSLGKCKPNVQLGSICGMKFNDLNGNGIKDDGEPGIANWKINLAEGATMSTYTDSNGNYCFNNLNPGKYTVSEANQPGWTQTAPSTGTYSYVLMPGQNLYGLDFGNTAETCLNNMKNWWPLGTGINNGTNGEVWALAVIGSDLYIGGNFTTAGGITANHIAKWDGSSWSPLISSNGVNGINGIVTALAVNGTELYAGGWFTDAGGILTNNIAKWDGSNWSAFGNGLQAAGAINALAIMGNDLYATSFILTPGLGGPGNLIVKWDGTSWSTFSVMDDYVSCLYVDGSNLYAGGQFTMANSVPANKIVKWDGTQWSSLGSGTNHWIGGQGIVIQNSNLYISGRFTTAGNNSANFIAKWDGSNWYSFGTGVNNGMNNEVEALISSGTDLYASGSFTTAEGINANNIAKWDGTNWSPLGSGMNDGVWRLAMIGNDLYAGGIFTTAGGASANYIAKYSCGIPTSINDRESETKLPLKYDLGQNYPNPFNPTTVISYNLPKSGFVKISVYDVLGKEIRVLVNENKNSGHYEIVFDGKGLSSGTYFYVIKTGEFMQSKKMILIK